MSQGPAWGRAPGSAPSHSNADEILYISEYWGFQGILLSVLWDLQSFRLSLGGGKSCWITSGHTPIFNLCRDLRSWLGVSSESKVDKGWLEEDQTVSISKSVLPFFPFK